MKWGFFFITIFYLFSCSNFYRAPQSEISHAYLHVVFDIDWTIVSNYESEVSKLSKSAEEKIHYVEGKPYIVRDHTIELIESLLAKNINISFFSGGTKSRNIDLLSKIILSDGRSLKEIAYKIKSFDDLTKVPNIPETAKFQERFKKDLLKITDDLSKVIIIDDAFNFFVNEEQKKNRLFLGPTYKYFEEYVAIGKKSGEYIPKSYDEWIFDRDKFKIIENLINDALSLKKTKQLSFVEAVYLMHEKYNLESGNYNLYTHKLRLPKIITDPVISGACGDLIIPFVK